VLAGRIVDRMVPRALSVNPARSVLHPMSAVGFASTGASESAAKFNSEVILMKNESSLSSGWPCLPRSQPPQNIQTNQFKVPFAFMVGETTCLPLTIVSSTPRHGRSAPAGPHRRWYLYADRSLTTIGRTGPTRTLCNSSASATSGS